MLTFLLKSRFQELLRALPRFAFFGGFFGFLDRSEYENLHSQNLPDLLILFFTAAAHQNPALAESEQMKLLREEKHNSM